MLDGVNSQVKVFDEKGAFLFLWQQRECKRSVLESPVGIATDSTGRVFVADTGNRRIQIFTSDGKVINEFSIHAPKGSQHPSDPVDIALDEQRNRIYVVDNDNHQVLLYYLDKFTFLESWGKVGDGRQDFRYPFFIAVGKDRIVLIVDVINTRVQACDPRG